MTWEMKLDERYDAGLREGREGGVQEGLSIVIHTMYNNGISVDKIAEMTDHSLDEIKKIIEKA